ncbi:MAG: hypothetical protein LBL95_06360, partial [Deltaproteobacteria bacterium]|nr:hypothetical protein [Deltaproteobacteria bacterium]
MGRVQTAYGRRFPPRAKAPAAAGPRWARPGQGGGARGSPRAKARSLGRSAGATGRPKNKKK